MKSTTNPLTAAAALAFASVLSSTTLIPVVRPLMRWVAPHSESAGHAFMALNLLGGIVAAPAIARLARRSHRRAALVTSLALLDSGLLLLIALPLPLGATLAVRTLQGALNIGVLSTIMGAAPPGDVSGRGARYGLLGTAMMLAVALGAPLGTVCLSMGLRAPLLLSAALNLGVAIGAPLAHLDEQEQALVPAAPFRDFWRGILWIFAERFSIGLFVVTFAMHARLCTSASDTRSGWMLTSFLVPFALAVYPAGRAADRVGAGLLGAGAAGVYGVGFFLLSLASSAQLFVLLPMLGLASAAIFASAMRDAGAAHASPSRVAAMSWLNSAGNLGMMLGTALAGIVCALLRARSVAEHSAHAIVFGIGGATSMLVAALTLGALFATRHLPHTIRVRS